MQMETLPSGTILNGRYRVERALGSGGFGHVYLSVDLETKQQYAIKEYLVTGASGKAQLEHEVDVLSNLHHSHLPALLSAFDENGRYYVMLNYIEGSDLTDYLRVVRQKNEPIPISRLIEWLLSICDAVTFLHSQHPPIIHRDIKPDNIRITPNGTAMLVDLGNAKTAADGARTLFFIRHQGTPGYAPLEQYPGGPGTTARSDVYALGGTLYFVLTAHEPPSVSARNQALQQKQPDLPTLQDRLAQNPPENQQEARPFRLGVSKPAKPVLRHSRHLAQLGTLPPELLRKLDAIIQRAMAMKPENRYPSVAEFSNDLKTVLKALPVTTQPATQRRPVDPHSTQPDLPMLYESMQKQPPAQSAPARQPQTPASAAIRCPNCKTDLNRPAPFCPHCGYPLNPPQPPKGPAGPPDAGQRYASKNAQQDISEEATMLIQPRVSPQEPPEQNRRSGSSSNQAAPRKETNPNQPTLRATRQQMLKTPSQPIPTVRPEQNAATARPIENVHTPIRSSQMNASSLSPPSTAVQSFMPSTLVSTTEQNQAPSHPPATSTRSNHADLTARKLFIGLAIIVVTLIIVMLLLLVFLRGHQISSESSQHFLHIAHNALKRQDRS